MIASRIMTTMASQGKRWLAHHSFACLRVFFFGVIFVTLLYVYEINIPLFASSVDPRLRIASQTERLTDGFRAIPSQPSGVCELPPWKPLPKTYKSLSIVPGKTYAHASSEERDGEWVDSVVVVCENISIASDTEKNLGGENLRYRIHKDKYWRTKDIQRVDNATDTFIINFPPKSKYMLLDCNGKTNVVQRPIHLPSVEARKERLSSLGMPTLHQRKGEQIFDNIVILLIDAVSRGAFIEMFPKSYELLTKLQGGKEKAGAFESFEFERLNVVGHNSMPNKYFGLLSGLKMDAFGATHDYHPPSKGENVDHGDFLFDRMTWANYATYYSSGDSSRSLKPYAKLTSRPDLEEEGLVDYIWPSDLASEGSKPYHNTSCTFPDTTMKFKNVDQPAFGIGNGFCSGQKSLSEHGFDSLHEFLSVYDLRKEEVKKLGIEGTFSFLSIQEAHEPYIRHNTIDELFRKNLQKLLDDKTLTNSSLILVVADHGLHYGDQFSNWPYKIWHRNPLFWMLASKNVLESHPTLKEGIQSNKKSLCTFFDVRKTLLHATLGSEEAIKVHLPKGTHADIFGHSLFNPLPRGRTCWDAGVPYKYCMCNVEQSKDAALINEQVKKEVVARIKSDLPEALTKKGLVDCTRANKCKPVTEEALTYPETFEIQSHDGLESLWFQVKLAGKHSDPKKKGIFPISAVCSFPSREDTKVLPNHLLCNVRI